MSDNMTNDDQTILVRRPLPDQIADVLLRSIVSGEIGEGEQLPTEHTLGERFGVSRTVVREAVRSLVARSLVEVRQGRGMWVASASAWDPLDKDIMRIRFERGDFGAAWWQFTEARMVFEAETAGLAARRREDRDLSALTAALDGMQRSGEDPERYRAADIDFHLYLVRAAHNSVLSRVLPP